MTPLLVHMYKCMYDCTARAVLCTCDKSLKVNLVKVGLCRI